MKTNCSQTQSFVCQDPLIGAAQSQTLSFPKESILSPSFYIWWKGVPGSSGIQVKWRIGNGSETERIEFVTEELSGSIYTPDLGSFPSSDATTKGHKYNALIQMPNNITDALSGLSLVVDIDIGDSKSDSVVELWITNLYLDGSSAETQKNAELICLAKGGHLPVIDSHYRQQRLQAFIAQEKLTSDTFWLGASDEKKEGDWLWSDGSQWSYTHWGPGMPQNRSLFGEDKEMDCLIADNGNWMDTSCNNKVDHKAFIKGTFIKVVCDLPIIGQIRSDMKLVYTSENISKEGMQFRWESKPYVSNQTITGGLNLTWELQQYSASSENTQEQRELELDKYSGDKTWNLLSALDLVRESEKKQISTDEVWGVLMKHRQEFFDTSSTCPSAKQITELILKIRRELNLDVSQLRWVSDDYLVILGFKMYAAITYCPGNQDEAGRLSLFFESLLTNNHSLSTIVAATVNSLQPVAGDNIKDFSTLNMWYKELDARYNFSLGPTVIALSNKKQLEELANLDPPYMEDYKDCLDSQGKTTCTKLSRSGTSNFFPCLILNQICSIRKGETLDQLSHPPHIIDLDGFKSASAFIPFCLYQSEAITSESTHQNISFPICTSFKPTFLEGQLCYKLDHQMHSGQGKKNELILLLDYNSDLSIMPPTISAGNKSRNLYLRTHDNEQSEAKIRINTLSQVVSFGGGSYKMTDVKRMTAKPDFLNMPLKDRNCEVEEYEDCRTRHLVERCDCVPVEVPGYQASNSYKYN